MFTSKRELSLGKNIRGKYILHTLIKKTRRGGGNEISFSLNYSCQKSALTHSRFKIRPSQSTDDQGIIIKKKASTSSSSEISKPLTKAYEVYSKNMKSLAHIKKV